MGCGNGKRAPPPKADGTPANGQNKFLDLLKLPKTDDASAVAKEAVTIQGSFFESIEETNKCLLCMSSNQQKVHTLDCTHSICINCAREQMETQLKTKSGTNIMYCCKICKAPKNLSKKLVHNY